MATSNVKNRAGRIFTNAMRRIDRIHEEIDRKAKKGKYNEDSVPNFKLATNGARIWSF